MMPKRPNAQTPGFSIPCRDFNKKYMEIISQQRSLSTNSTPRLFVGSAWPAALLGTSARVHGALTCPRRGHPPTDRNGPSQTQHDSRASYGHNTRTHVPQHPTHADICAAPTHSRTHSTQVARRPRPNAMPFDQTRLV
jgi:hypothetical protein